MHLNLGSNPIRFEKHERKGGPLWMWIWLDLVGPDGDGEHKRHSLWQCSFFKVGIRPICWIYTPPPSNNHLFPVWHYISSRDSPNKICQICHWASWEGGESQQPIAAAAATHSPVAPWVEFADFPTDGEWFGELPSASFQDWVVWEKTLKLWMIIMNEMTLWIYSTNVSVFKNKLYHPFLSTTDPSTVHCKYCKYKG